MAEVSAAEAQSGIKNRLAKADRISLGVDGWRDARTRRCRGFAIGCRLDRAFRFCSLALDRTNVLCESGAYLLEQTPDVLAEVDIEARIVNVYADAAHTNRSKFPVSASLVWVPSVCHYPNLMFFAFALAGSDNREGLPFFFSIQTHFCRGTLQGDHLIPGLSGQVYPSQLKATTG
jgi:hypothetical protein